MKRVHDTAEVMPFLMQRPTIAMFPMTNLRDHGIGGDHPRSMTVWAQSCGDQITDVLAVTGAGIVLPVFTTTPPASAVLTGHPITGIIGQAACVETLHRELGLPSGDLHRIEPHFELPLCDLACPDTAHLTLEHTHHIDRDLLIAWRTAYGMDALNLAPENAATQAATDVDKMTAQQSHRILMDADTPVAMTGFNAVVDDTVMIGGVYTPAHLRGRGYARAAVALHLAQARAQGMTTAVLSAANLAAAAVYTAIGFRQVGQFMIILFNKPQVSHG